MQLTEHFSLEELIASESATRRGIDNTPRDALMPNLRTLAEGLERVRATLGSMPVHINSGYRCPRLNDIVGGAQNSLHMQALAADILCPQFGAPLEVCRAIAASDIHLDQIIYEFGGWCHVSFPLRGTVGRKQLFTIASTARGYQPGLNPIV